MFFRGIDFIASRHVFSFLFRNFGIVSAISSPIRSVIARVDSVVSTPFRFLDSANEEIRDLFNTYSENKELKQKVAELEDQSELIDSLKEENEELNSEIGALSLITSQFSATGKVIVRSPVSWYNSLTVKLGKKNNITKKC